jgi:Protein of unknown function (DUF3108)
VHAISLLVTALRLTCWPFEVEGQGEGAPLPAITSPSPAHAPEGGGSQATRPVVLPPSLPRDELVRYDVRYGLFGSIGELVVSAGSVAYPPDGPPIVTVRGTGRGEVLGLGGMERRIESEFDVQALGSRRWTEARRKAGQRVEEETVDTGERSDRGQNRVHRRMPGKADETQTFMSVVPTSDFLGLIWRLRTAPPALGHAEVARVLDGLALWEVRATTVSADDPVPDRQGARALRVEGHLTPIYYDGGEDGARSKRSFTMWLDPRASHLPLRLEIPVGPGHVVLDLVEVKRVMAGADQLGVPVPGARSL